MRIQTTDPITGNDVKEPGDAPFIIEGSGDDALKIYFETEASKKVYLDVEFEELSGHSVKVFNRTTGNAREM